jgi:DNA-binding beta-propeller fold protein YncE
MSILVVTIGLYRRPLLAAQGATYKEVSGWTQLPAGLKWGGMSGVAIAADGKIYAFQRADSEQNVAANVMVFAPDGTYLKSWGQGAFVFPHGLRILQDGDVWATDREMQQALKFDEDGTLLSSIGRKNVIGDMNSTDAFHGVSDIAMAFNGDLFLSDGEGGNARIVKLSKDGHYLMSWGTKGTGPGQLSSPHCIGIDPQSRVWVCDRGNTRMQLFDVNGRYLEQMTQFGAPVSVVFQNNLAYVATGAPDNCVTIATLDGKVIERIGGLDSPHALAVTPDGKVIYVAETAGGNGNLVKLVRQK